MLTAIDWKKLCEEAHDHALKSGFLEKKRTFAGDTALMHSEISEALEEYRDGHAFDKIYYKFSLDATDPEVVARLNFLLNNSPTPEEYLLEPVAVMAKMKPEGIPIELADCAIRIAQFCGTEHVDLADALKRISSIARKRAENFEELCAMVHSNLSKVYDYFEENRGYNDYGFAKALWTMVDFCEKNNIDLGKAIQVKTTFNRTRGHKHGGKKI